MGISAGVDVGATLAALHAPERRPAQWARYERGEITPWQFNLEILHGLPLSVEDLDRFDPCLGAAALLAWRSSSRAADATRPQTAGSSPEAAENDVRGPTP